MNNFGKLLKKARLRADIGLRRFAEMIDMEPSKYSAIEHGRIESKAAMEKIYAIIDKLMSKPNLNRGESRMLEVLSILVEQYESSHEADQDA